MNLSCKTLVGRLQFSFNDVKLRQSMLKIKRFTNRVKKTESVQMVTHIVKKHLLFEYFVKWVKVVYREELGFE